MAFCPILRIQIFVDLLTTAGTTFIQSVAGFTPSVDDKSSPERCSLEEGEYCGDDILGLILDMFISDVFQVLQPVFVTRFLRKKLIIPSDRLAYLIAQDLRSNQIEALQGKRGKWLRHHMRMRSYDALQRSATASPFNVFSQPQKRRHTGTAWDQPSHHECKRFLRTLRHDNPAAARELLMTTWPDEIPPNRQEYLLCMLVNLSPEDEPFITYIGNYEEKRALIPENGFVCALYDTPGMHFRQTVNHLVVDFLHYDHEAHTLRVTHAGDMSAFDLPYANWEHIFRNCLEIVPPRFWLERWSIGSDDLLSAAQKNDEMAYYRLMWFKAALRTGDSDFVACYVMRHGLDIDHEKVLPGVIELLDAETCMRVMLHCLYQHHIDLFKNPAYHFLAHYKPDFDYETYTTAFMEVLRHKSPAEFTWLELSDICFKLFLRVPLHHEPDLIRFVEHLYSSDSSEENVVEENTALEEALLRAKFFFDFRRRMHAAFGDEQP